MTDRDRRFFTTLGIIVAIGFVARLAFLVLFDNVYSHEAESYSKINLVSVWVDAGKPYPDINFGPLHTWIIYGLQSLFSYAVPPVRLFSLLCGTLAILLFALCARLMFEDRVALIGAALFSTMPVHLRSSAVSLAEGPYALLIAAGLYFHMKYRHKRGAKFLWLVWSALFLNMAGALRFETWLFLPLLCLFLVRKNFLHAVAFGAMNLVFPATHMYMSFKQTGNPLSFAATSSTSFLQYMPMMPLSYKLTGWFVSFAEGMTIAVAVLAALGLFTAAFSRKGFHFASLFLFMFSIFQYKALTNTIDPALTRYTAGMTLLLLPFAGIVLSETVRKFFGRDRTGAIALTVLVALFCAQGLVFSVLQTLKNQLPDDAKQAVQFLRERTGPSDRVMADSRFHPYFMVESHLPNDRFVSLRFSADRMNLDEQYMAKLLEKTPPTIVVLDYSLEGVDQVNSNLDAFSIPREAKAFASHGLSFTRIAQFGDFSIYSTKPEQPGGKQ